MTKEHEGSGVAAAYGLMSGGDTSAPVRTPAEEAGDGLVATALREVGMLRREVAQLRERDHRQEFVLDAVAATRFDIIEGRLCAIEGAELVTEMGILRARVLRLEAVARPAAELEARVRELATSWDMQLTELVTSPIRRTPEVNLLRRCADELIALVGGRKP